MKESYIETDDKVVRIVGTVEKEKKTKETGVFIDGKGYADENGTIWIYSYSGKPSNSNEYPYFWINSDGVKEFSHPEESVLKLWNTSNASDKDLDTISALTKEDTEVYDEDEVNAMNESSSKYVPIVKDSEDFLKKIIKHLILQKGINISRLKYKMTAKYSLPNMTSALSNTTKMSVTYFSIWAELLGVNFKIIIEDNGTDTINPLKEPIVYDSYHDTIKTESGEVL